MHKGDTLSIFSEYYRAQPLVDRSEADSARAVDVIIPIIHTNEMWRANLLSIYREIPVNRLILGDGGCTDDSLDVAREFPRVEVLDQRHYTSLGFSLRHLIEATETEWFVYLHSDVYLPSGWFEIMSAHRDKFDWFECNQRITVMADYLMDTTKVARSYSGSQMGRKATFEKVTPLIDDDFLYRNEDIIFAKLVERTGGRYGKVGDTHHFHQVMYKPSRWHRAIRRVTIEPDIARDEDIRANRTYAQGIIKYLQPSEVTPDLVESVRGAIDRLDELGDVDRVQFLSWVRATNAQWLPVMTPSKPSQQTIGTADQTISPAQLRRNRTTEQLVRFAGLYQTHGWARALLIVLKRAAVALLQLLLSPIRRLRAAVRNVVLKLRTTGWFVYVRGASRRLLTIYRTDGIAEVFAFLRTRIVQLRATRAVK